MGLLEVRVDLLRRSGTVSCASAAAADLLGRPPDGVAGDDPAFLLGDTVWTGLLDGLGTAASGRLEGDVPAPDVGRRHVVVQWLARPDPTAGDAGVLVLLALDDVGERRRLMRSLRRKALHDPLTGLPNRTLLLEHLEQALRESERDASTVAVAYLDVDNLKWVNETLGHEAGDALLGTVAQRLRRASRFSDIAGRLGGDEFAVVCRGLPDEREAVGIGHRLVSVVAGTCVAAGHDVPLSVSVGVATATGWDEQASATLLNRADEAGRRAKREGKNRHVVFDEDLDEQLRREQLLAADLRGAAHSGELQLRYQPLVRLADERLVGVEALLRWCHPRLGVLLPADFLPLAESTGSIHELGEWVLEEACAQAVAWRGAGSALVLSLNVSAHQLGRGEVARALSACAARHGLLPDQFRIEVTESALVRTGALRELRDLDERGFVVGIDDFGTGYASMTLLRDMPAGFVKIDRSFVTGMIEDGVRRAIVQSVITLADALDVAVVAEGIESREQAEMLRRMGCPTGQGFLYGQPVAPERLVLGASRGRPGPASTAR